MRAMTGPAIASLMLALAAAVLVPMGLWYVAIPCALAGISTSLQARRALRADPNLRGTTFSLIGFLMSAVVLFVTLWPTVLFLWGLIRTQLG
ncbi:hypothetical protein [Microbacterium sp. A93]|uniref:hypothetical protein n=1 Tax=Microbacterium sp. A93 TaxID=3450716 RepID=UPI003F42EB8B